MRRDYVEISLHQEEYQSLCEMNDAYRRAAKAADAHREAEAAYDNAAKVLHVAKVEAAQADRALGAAVEAYRIQMLSRR